MAFFWFIIVVVLLIVIARHKPTEPDGDRYAQGYWDGFRAAGTRVAHELSRPELSRDELQKIVTDGHGDQPVPQIAASTPTVVQSAAVELSAVSSAITTAPPADHGLRNLNILLYMASFLLVAAATAFVAAAMPADVRLVGLLTVVVLFYGAGMVLHQYVPRLRPAAVAFIGTGLAILPFVGVALHLLGGVPAAVSWCIISCIGLIAYAVAAVVLQSQVVSYLTMAFVLSLASSVAATASLPLVGHFVALIGVSLLANVISFVWPRRVPSLFRLPIEQTGQIVTPLTVLASLFVGPQMTIRMYELLFLVVSAHYLVVWLQLRRYWQLSVVRGALHVTALLFAWDNTSGATQSFAVWWLALAALQAAVSFVLVRKADATSRLRETEWLIVAASVMLIGAAWWLPTAHAALGVAITVGIFGVVALMALVRVGGIGWAYAGLMASLVLPFVIGRGVIQPALPWAVLAGCFSVFAALTVVGSYFLLERDRSLQRRDQFFAAAIMAYVAMVVLCSLFAQRDAEGWQALTLAAAAIAAWAGSYAVRAPGLTIAGNVSFVLLVVRFWDWLRFDATWAIFGVAWLAAGLIYGVYWLMVEREDTWRQWSCLGSVWAVLGGASLAQYFHYSPLQQAAAAGSIAVIGLTLGVHGYLLRRLNLVEAGFYVAIFGTQRLVGVAIPELTVVFYAHWWALALALVAWKRGLGQRLVRLVIAMAIITLAVGTMALSGNLGYQLLFLIEHIVLLIIGAATQRQWAIWWGIIASVLAILYFLKGYPFVWLAFLGFFLIGVVVWRLNKSHDQLGE